MCIVFFTYVNVVVPVPLVEHVDVNNTLIQALLEKEIQGEKKNKKVPSVLVYHVGAHQIIRCLGLCTYIYIHVSNI